MSLDVGFMRNIRNNAYNKTMRKYLMLQEPNPQLINGKIQPYVPSTRWSATGKPPYKNNLQKSGLLMKANFVKGFILLQLHLRELFLTQ